MQYSTSNEEWQATIRKLPVLQNVSSALIGQITQEMSRPFRDGDTIFDQSDMPRELYIILRGQVCIRAGGVFIVARTAGEVFGEQAWIEGTPRTASAVAQGAAQVLAVPAAIVSRLMADSAFLQNLLRLLSSKLSQATEERAYRYRVEELLFSEFRAHVSEPVLRQLVSSGHNYSEPRFVDGVILFSDIRSFTELSAHMEPAEIAIQLGQYLDAVVDIIHKHEGLVDKFIGDAVMVIWGYSPGDVSMSSRALACARKMVQVAADMSFNGEPIHIGVGLNAGTFFLGNIGGNGKRQFTALGTPVNMAARFEGASKTLEAPVVVGQAFYDRLMPADQAELESHPHQLIKGADDQTLYTYGRYKS